jgi:hypothetical protein
MGSAESGAPEYEVQVREPRCRVCRHEAVRVLVNQMLDWHGVPVMVKGGRAHRLTYSDILRGLESLNQGLHSGERITYDSLWVHAQRHHALDGMVAFWSKRIEKGLEIAFGNPDEGA